MAELKTYRSPLFKLGYRTIQELETDNGILASGKNEIYGCIFGRDSLITSLELLKTYEKTQDKYLLGLVKKILINLAVLQGKYTNIESGEEPGKMIHEFRPENHEHLTKHSDSPWFVYPDNIMRNYDTVDATPLFLIAAHRYYTLSNDAAFLDHILPSIQAALDWIFATSERSDGGFVTYHFHPNRAYGGLKTQSWMDSTESVFYEDSAAKPRYPIAPVEVQAYTYLALRSWQNYFADFAPKRSKQIDVQATRLKKHFNEKFINRNAGFLGLAFAIDGNGIPLTSARSSMGHVLWAAVKEADGAFETILRDEYIPLLVDRLMQPDLFEPRAGLRTLSSLSSQFDPSSYHNGSIWPHDTSLFIEGLMNFGYEDEARKVRRALLSAYRHFQTPIELFTYKDGKYDEFRGDNGQTGCKKQAWSAAALLAETMEYERRRV